MFKSILLLFACACLGTAWADDWPADIPLPQDALLPTTLDTIYKNRDDIQNVNVVVQIGLGKENPSWTIRQVPIQVLVNKLLNMPEQPTPEDDIWPKLKPKDKNYRGITLVFSTVDNKYFNPINVFEGKVTNAEGLLLAPDFGRQLEYWLFGTPRVKRDQMLGVAVLPVISFEQCRILGQRIVETVPRQCLLPDNNLLLETGEMPTVKSAQMKDFDECLKNGDALIYTFPRRCITKGGRVFTEPPRVFENTATDAPLIISTTQPGMPQVSVTALGNFNVEPAAGPATPRKKLKPGFYPDIEWADYGQHP